MASFVPPTLPIRPWTLSRGSAGPARPVCRPRCHQGVRWLQMCSHTVPKHPHQQQAYQAEVHAAVEAVRRACQVCVRVRRDARGADKFRKSDRTPVTVADLAVQALVILTLKEQFPADSFLAEEDAAMLRDFPDTRARVCDLVREHLPLVDDEGVMRAVENSNGGGSGRLWVLDPIDGTRGFVMDRNYCVGLALMDPSGGGYVVGVLGTPSVDEEVGTTSGILAAGRGTGLQIFDLDGLPRPESLPGSGVDGVWTLSGANSSPIVASAGRPPERLCCGSLIKYYAVSQGAVDCFIQLGKRPTAGTPTRFRSWDHAPGILVVQESKGRVTDIDLSEVSLERGATFAVDNAIVATRAGADHDFYCARAREAVESLAAQCA